MAIFSQRAREGYVMVDHRASPGLSAFDAARSGYHPDQCGEGKLFEAASLTCAHCKTVVVKNPLRTRERAHCVRCHAFICDPCAFKASMPDAVHAPYEKVVDDHLNAAARRSSLILL